MENNKNPNTALENNRPIGIFDSGMGGLTVLKQLKKLLPNETFIYLGDTARLPYGTKSPETIIQYSLQNARLLIEKGIKLLVIACNTASAVALPKLKAAFPELPVIGVLEPGAESASQATKNGNVLVIATETTINTGGYQNAIKHINPRINVTTRSCSVLVSLAEEGWVDNIVAQAAINEYLMPLISSHHDFDCIVLGCTHFPVFAKLIQNMLDNNIILVDSAKSTAIAVQQLLANRDLVNNSKKNNDSKTSYLVTDSPERFRRIGRIFLGETIPGEMVALVDNQ